MATDRTGPDGSTIAAVSRLLGIPVPTIRSWERRYGFPTPGRTPGRHRRYSMDEVEQLRALRDEITRGHPAREAVAIVRRRDVGDGRRHGYVEEFLRASSTLDPDALRGVLDRAAEGLGIEAAIRDVVGPSMREIGSRWKAGECDVAEEHLATEAVRVWLARHLTMTPTPFRPRPLILACGPKDLHSIGLEMFAVILARRGWSCRVLGAHTPSRSLVTAVRAADARGVVVTSQRNVTRRAAMESLEEVAAIPGVHTFYAGGGFAAPSSRRGVPGTYLGEDLLEAAAALERELLAEPERARAGA